MKFKIRMTSESPVDNIPGVSKEGDYWVVDIQSLEELMTFIERQDVETIIHAVGGEIPCIEIYDDYRE